MQRAAMRMKVMGRSTSGKQSNYHVSQVGSIHNASGARALYTHIHSDTDTDWVLAKKNLDPFSTGVYKMRYTGNMETAWSNTSETKASAIALVGKVSV